ncbi:MAG TPA: protease inhibitor I42 family protein [Verrucomicrobiae bacterium]|nr:protease inhibitor I42 family protein [Verrucomicrobiae bacterium]
MKRFILLLFALSCVAGGAGAEEKPKPIKAAVGEEFKLTLESNPASGNQWLLARPLDERLLKLLGSEYKRGRSGGAAGPGSDVLSFRALAEGKTEIYLKYGKLWENDVAPARKTNFVVVITRMTGR